MIQRREFIAVLGGAAPWPLAASAQQRTLPVIGILGSTTAKAAAPFVSDFMQGLKDTGFVEGQNIAIEAHWANDQYDRLPAMAAELVRARVALIFAFGNNLPTRAAKNATSTIPIVFGMGADPVQLGIVDGLSRPGGNVTGVYTMTEEMNPKRLALLKEVAPSVHRVGVLLRQDFPSEGIAKRDWQNAELAAHQLELELLALNVRTANEITTAFDQASANGVQGIITFRNPTVVTYLEIIAGLSRKRRLPAMFDAREYVEAGGLMSYGPNIDRSYRQLATYAYKLLHGTPVSNLPIEQPTTFELVINKHTASDIGISIPSSLLTRADKVIE